MVSHRKKNSQAGFYIVFMAIIVTALLLACSLVIVLGILSANRARHHNSTNLTALAAVDEFSRHLSVNDYHDRAELIRQRASYIMGQNSLIAAGTAATQGDFGFPPGIGQPSTAPGGTIRLGNWVPSDPDGAGPEDPCGGNYGCFIELPPPPPNPGSNIPIPQINAVRIEAKTQQPIIAPLANLFGSSGMYLDSTATASVIPRCTVMLADISMSSTSDSHLSNYKSEDHYGLRSATSAPEDPTQPLPACLTGLPLAFPTKYYLCPRNLAQFAYNEWIQNRPFPSPATMDLLSNFGSGNPCRVSDSDFNPENHYIYNTSMPNPTTGNEGHIWCNMQFDKGAFPSPVVNGGLRLRNGLTDKTLHFPEDYRYANTPYGRMIVDMYVDPQPLGSFFLGFNAGARLFDEMRTGADRVRFVAFKGTDYNPYPPSGFSSDPSGIVQVTNVKNRGTIDETGAQINPVVHPNFLDFGYFPIRARGVSGQNQLEGGTNILNTLNNAIDALGDTSFCPASAQKSIIMATDGVASCVPGLTPTCKDDYSYFTQTEQYLLQDSILFGDSVLKRLKAGKISLTVLFAGNHVKPHIIDHKDPNDNHFLDYQEMVARGFQSWPPSPSLGNYMYDSRSEASSNYTGICPDLIGTGTHPCTEDEYAFYNAGKEPGTYFKRSMGILAHMAQETGGIFCPLLARPDSIPGNPPTNIVRDEWYFDDDGDETSVPPNPNPTPRKLREVALDGTVLRVDGQPQFYAPVFYSEGEAAGDCVRRTLSLNSNILVEGE